MALTLLQLTPVLSLVLVHDLLLSKKGVALPAKHGLHATIRRYKARLISELTKARLRRGCATLGALREHVNGGAFVSHANGSEYVHPRWIRINSIFTSLSRERDITFAGLTEVSDLSTVTSATSGNNKIIYFDPHVPDLVAVPSGQDFSAHTAYREGRLIFQEKASCFPACLLDPVSVQGEIIDACAAPGNKTTHLAGMLASAGKPNKDSKYRKIYACEKDAARSQTLEKMVKLAGAGNLVKVRAKQDFLKLDPNAPEFKNVNALLLDPSCSGSGIMGRDEARVIIHLPSRDGGKQQEPTRGKKRKRDQQPVAVKLDNADEADPAAEEAVPSMIETEDASKLATRLLNLSAFQLRLLQHAMSFPSAKRITYSTCSLHKEENENVVARALSSDDARHRGWRVLRRAEQVEGMRAWGLRGSREAVAETAGADGLDAEEAAEACLRCEKGGEGGTMGFFVVCLVRDGDRSEVNGKAGKIKEGPAVNGHIKAEDGEDEEWEGFSDDDG